MQGYDLSGWLRPWRAAGIVCLALVMASPARGDFYSTIDALTADSTEGLGVFAGSVSFDSGALSLQFSLTNTSPAANGGVITGFAFTLPAGVTAAPDTFSYPAFQFVSPVGVAPWGTLSAGAALGGDWQGGGPPFGGIPVGGTGDFSFSLSGEITLAQMFPDPDAVAFAVRFRGFEDGGSDKVPGWGDPGVTPTDPIPEPASLITGALLLLGSGAIARRKKVRRVA